MKVKVSVYHKDVICKRLFIVCFNHEVKEFNLLIDAIDYGLTILDDDSNDSIEEYFDSFKEALLCMDVV